MKLVTYQREHGPYRTGVVAYDRVYDIAMGLRLDSHGEAALDNNSGQYDLDMRRLMEWDLIPRISELVERVALEIDNNAERLTSLGVLCPVEDVRFGPPVLEPSKVVAVALNYQSHAIEAGVPIPKAPPLFPKYPTNLVGHGDPVRIPSLSSSIDYEGELGVVIGAYASNVSQQDASDVVLGYTVLNDVTARDYQHMTSQFTAGKCFDTFSPIGPWIVTRDEVPAPNELTLQTYVNDELRQDDSTAGMLFDIAELIEFISSVMTLVPGDIIATGTPGGVGAFKKPPQWLIKGDSVRVAISGIGSLENPVTSTER